MENCKISVVIPVYKTEQYIRECVDGILAQSADGIEIILVDDASPDQCPEICDEYAAAHENVFVIHKENAGVGAARRDGIAAARGKYVMLLDSDDLPDGNDALKTLYDTAEESGADITVGNYRYIRDGKISDTKILGLKTGDDSDTEEFRFRGFYGGGHLSYVWAKLYRKDFLIENKIESPTYGFTQDKLFNFYCYASRARYAFTEKSVHLYRVNLQSVTFRYKENYGGGWLSIGRDMERYAKEKNREEVFDIIAYHVLFGSLFVAKQEYLHQKSGRIAAMKNALAKYASDELTERAAHALAGGQYKQGGKLLRLETMFAAKRLSAKKFTLLSLGIAALVKAKML